MGFFAGIYNKVAKFFRPQEEIEDASKEVATNRLKLVLMQDRTNLTPKVLEQMRGELIDLLSKYLELDKDLLELNFEQEGDQVALMLSIPVIRAKDEDEIEEAMKLIDEADDVEIIESEIEEEEEENEEQPSEETEEIQEIDSSISETSDIESNISSQQDETSTVSAPKEMSSSKKEEKQTSTDKV